MIKKKKKKRKVFSCVTNIKPKLFFKKITNFYSKKIVLTFPPL